MLHIYRIMAFVSNWTPLDEVCELEDVELSGLHGSKPSYLYNIDTAFGTSSQDCASHELYSPHHADVAALRNTHSFDVKIETAPLEQHDIEFTGGFETTPASYACKDDKKTKDNETTRQCYLDSTNQKSYNIQSFGDPVDEEVSKIPQLFIATER